MGYVDADAHVSSNRPIPGPISPEADKRFAPIQVSQIGGREVRAADHGRRAVEYWIMDNRTHARDQNITYEATAESRELEDVGQAPSPIWIQLGIDTQIIFPTVFLRPAVRTRDAERVLTRSYNRWLGEIWAHAPKRLRWVAMPPLLSLELLARDELSWAKENGACGIFMRGYEWDKTLGDSPFFPIYELASGAQAADLRPYRQQLRSPSMISSSRTPPSPSSSSRW